MSMVAFSSEGRRFGRQRRLEEIRINFACIIAAAGSFPQDPCIPGISFARRLDTAFKGFHDSDIETLFDRQIGTEARRDDGLPNTGIGTRYENAFHYLTIDARRIARLMKSDAHMSASPVLFSSEIFFSKSAVKVAPTIFTATRARIIYTAAYISISTAVASTFHMIAPN